MTNGWCQFKKSRVSGASKSTGPPEVSIVRRVRIGLIRIDILSKVCVIF